MEEEKGRSLRDEIYARMSEKDTEDLIEIYHENDLESPTEESLEIVRQILLERLGTLPEPETEAEEESSPDEEEEEEFEFPQDKVLYRIADWSSRLSGIIVAVAVINVIVKSGSYFAFIIDVPLAEWNSSRIFDLVITILSYLETLLYAGFLYLLLQAVTEVIYLLMDIRDLFQATEKVGESV